MLEIVEKVVAACGCELVEIERSTGGLLRVTIDHRWQPGMPAAPVTLDDCERVTRQLQYALEVEGVDYRRLEVSSPGIDRLLRSQRDFERFEGAVIDLTLKAPIGAAACGAVAPSRKRFRGVLRRGPAGWQLLWREEAAPAADGPGRRPPRRAPPAPERVMDFSLDELKEARLAPIVDFKGRGAPGAG